MGYEVLIEEMRAAARAAGDAAEVTRGVELGAEVDDIAAAMPGGQAGPAATALAGVWAGQIRSWSADAREYATNVSGAADGYVGAEDDATAGFRAVG